ncbi:DNA-3-methyladenine glycosylase 2 family protein [Gordonia sp. OPL2]|nr:DNA-3-methyladenine glycosylase 2 family protein [Gordonia sp. OPL2]
MSASSDRHVRFPPGFSADHCHSGVVTTAIRTPETLEFDRCYRAVSSRDARFDGQFFVAVHTTGIYCRPSCPAQTPRPRNVHFVLTAAAAQQEGFRACRRCAPDAVPGSPLWNSGADLSSRAMRLITDGVVERDGVDGLATRLGYTPRHLNRVLTEHLGAGPLALARAHRAATARVLIQCTAMPMSDIAFAAGFTSVRQFNDTIREVFGLTPSRLRTLPSPSRTPATSAVGEVTLRLAYRPPLDTRWLHWFLASHATAGVEIVDTLDDGRWRYRRAVELPHGPALITVEPATAHIVARVAHLDMRDLAVAVNRIRRLLDLDADAQSTDAALGRDPVLAPLVAAAPGLRVPGAIDPAETLIRTMIGQQISVKAARHHINRLTGELGRTPSCATDGDAEDWMLFPDSATIAEHGHRILTGPRRRIDAVVGAATALAERRIELHPGCSTDDMRAALLALPGVGRWTADYVAMRVTGDPDILLDRDLVVARAAEELGVDLPGGASRWSPWRSYASMHLWRHRLSVTEAILGTEISSVPTSTRQPTRATHRSPRRSTTSPRRSTPVEPAQGAR